MERDNQDDSEDEFPILEPNQMQLINKRGLHTEYGNQADEHTIEPEVQLPNVESQANNDSIVEEELRQRSRRTRNPPTRLVYNQLGRPQEQQNFFVSSVQPSLKADSLIHNSIQLHQYFSLAEIVMFLINRYGLVPYLRIHTGNRHLFHILAFDLVMKN